MRFSNFHLDARRGELTHDVTVASPTRARQAKQPSVIGIQHARAITTYRPARAILRKDGTLSVSVEMAAPADLKKARDRVGNELARLGKRALMLHSSLRNSLAGRNGHVAP